MNAIKAKRKTIPMPVRDLINTALIVVFVLGGSALTGSGAVSGYVTKVLMLIGINIILAVSLNVATGYLGQLPLGHAGFMAVGAYAGGIFLKAVNAAKLAGAARVGAVAAALLLSGIVAAVFGILIGVLVSMKLPLHMNFLAIAVPAVVAGIAIALIDARKQANAAQN